MSSIASIRPHFQQLATLVRGHAAARQWPAVTYQADFRTVVFVGGSRPTQQGNSVFWNSDWDSGAASVDHAVGVKSGAKAWQAFLQKALYPDLQRADAELLKL